MNHQKLASIFLVCLVFLSFFCFLNVPLVSAALPSQTVKYWSSTADGYVTNSTLPHATATAGVAGTVTNTTTTSYVGQKMDNTSFTTKVPNAVGDYSNWTKLSGTYNYQMVDEADEPDDDTTYVSCTAANLIDLYNFANMTLAPDAWAQVVITVVAKKVSVAGAIVPIVKVGSVIYNGSQSALTTSYAYYTYTLALNPATGTSWTATTINALQIGFNSGSTTPSASVRVTWCTIDVYYCTPTIYRAAEYFDTSSIPDSATISAATMYLYVTSDKAETSFNLLVENSTSGAWPANPLNTTSYNKANYLTSAGASFTMFGVSGVADVVLNATGLAMISKTGVTKLFLISSRDKAGTVCGFQSTNDEEYVIFSSTEGTVLQRPYLQITWNSESPQCIYADSFSSAEATWSAVGSSPYVDDSSASYIQSFTATNESLFGFPDATALPSQTWLEVEAQGGEVASYCTIILNDGVTNNTVATVCFDRFTSWKSYNVTTVLSTVTKLQAASVRFTALNATTAFGNRIYRLRLRLYTGPVPLYNTLGVSTPEVNVTATFSCQWNGAVTASLTQNSTGSFVTTNVSISSGWGNLTALLPTNSCNVVLYWFNANDSSNVWERTENYTLKLLWPSYDSTAYNMIDSDTGTLAHSLGRQVFFDSVTNLYWIKYFKLNASSLWNLDYAYSSDGKAWTHGGTIRENATVTDAGSGFTYWLLEQRGGVSYCHIQYGNETITTGNIEYRRGLLNSDGTITFTAWQIAVACSANTRLACEGFAVSPSGHVWIGYEVGPNNDYDHGYENITMSTATDGSWSTHASYPQKVMDNLGVIAEGLVFSTGQDYYAIMVLCPSSNATVKNYVKSYEIQNNVLQSVVNVSTTPTFEARYFSIARDSSSQLHLAYKNWTDYINYCKWNTTTWNVQDTNVGYGNAYPVISCHKTVNETYVNWVIEGDCWLNVYNGTSNSWRGLERMHGLTGQKEYSDPNHVIEQVDQYVLFAFNVYNWTTGTTEIWSYRYVVTFVQTIRFYTSILFGFIVDAYPRYNWYRYHNMPMSFNVEQQKTVDFTKESAMSLSFVLDAFRNYALSGVGTVPVSFSFDKQRAVTWALSSVMPLGFTVQTLYEKLAGILRFFSDILFQFTLNVQRGIMFNRQGTATFEFSFDSEKAVSMVQGFAVPLSFVVSNGYGRLATILSFLSSILFEFALNSYKTVTFSRDGVAQLNFVLNAGRAISWNIGGTIPLVFTVQSIYERIFTVLQFYGEMVFQFALNSKRTIQFTFDSATTLSFIVNSVGHFMFPGWLFVNSVIDFLFAVGNSGYAVLPLSNLTYPTSSLAWAAAFIIIGLLLGLLLMSKRGDENG